MGTVIKISVRRLVEYVLRRGSIESGFVGSSVLTEGTMAHKLIQEKQGDDYDSEVSLKADINYRDMIFKIDGRCDGIISNEVVTIDEIKSTRKDLEYIQEDDNQVYWGQAKVYAYIYALSEALDKVNVQLTYFNVNTQQEKKFIKLFDIKELKVFIEYLLEEYLVYANLKIKVEKDSTESIKGLEFPFENYRQGQREMAIAVYKTIKKENKIFANAPTGTGKTISTLFPSIKALGEEHIEKIIYLTAKTITKKVAEDTINILHDKGLRSKSVTITAKEKICFMEEVNCTKEYCPYADGYYEKLNKVIIDIFKNETFIGRNIIENYAKKHVICPFELSLDISLLAHIVICDYNYFFDPRASLKRLRGDNKSPYVLLIDEAHNLVDRARDMFSANLVKSEILNMKRKFKFKDKNMRECFNKLNTFMINLRKNNEENRYTLKDKPKDIGTLLNKFINTGEKWLMDNKNDEAYKDVLELYFKCNNFFKIFKLYDHRYITYVEKRSGEVSLKLFCLDPSFLINEITKANKATVFFSATLFPIRYYRSLLGANDEDWNIFLPSPFQRKNLEVFISKISTRYKDREYTYEKIANTIGNMIKLKKCNTLVFFPSYKYMEKVYDLFKSNFSNEKTIIQSYNMTEIERVEFLTHFEKNSNMTAFAVMGGVFSEGIDLRGDLLEGVIIVGVGLPQLCFERDIIKEYFNSEGESGYDFSYVYPGINKVLQAGGRLIRTESDKGYLMLIDDRFLTSKYQNMLPYEWKKFNKI